MGIFGTAFWLIKWAVFIAVSIVIVYTGIGIMRSESFASSSTSPLAETHAVAGDAGVMESDKNPTTAQMVVRAFMRELDRIPSDEELRHYVDMFADSKYNDDKMTTLLQSSEEYTRRMKMQSNMVNADNVARITERETEGIIRKAYVDVYGQNPSPATQAYLHSRFLDMDMNQSHFVQFLKRLHAAEQGNGQVGSYDGLAVPHQGTPQALDVSQQSSSGQRIGAAKQCLEKRDRQDYDLASQQRRSDDLSTALGRCRDQERPHGSASGGMVLLPGMEWSVPQPRPPVCLPCPTSCPVQPSLDQTSLLGTLLSDANDTQVGSMMPKFTYSEERFSIPP